MRFEKTNSGEIFYNGKKNIETSTPYQLYF